MFLLLTAGSSNSPRQTSARRPAPTSANSATATTGQQAPAPRSTTTTAEPLKFEGEFDFEQANARFEEEIEKEFTDKLKISTTTGGKPTSQQRDSQQQDTSLNTSQSLTLDHDQQHMLIKEKSMHSLDMKHHSAEPSHVHLHMKESLSSKPSNNSNSNTIDEDNKNFYDKNLSFFDRISCEASEKSQSKPKNWKEERKMNAETFGLLQRQQQQELKSYHYNRTYNNNNYRGNNNNAGNNTNGGRNYPRNAPTSGNQQQQQQSSQYRGGNMRYNNNNNGTGMGPRVAAGTGNTNNSRGYNSRRNDMDNSYNGGSRRFGSR